MSKTLNIVSHAIVFKRTNTSTTRSSYCSVKDIKHCISWLITIVCITDNIFATKLNLLLRARQCCTPQHSHLSIPTNWFQHNVLAATHYIVSYFSILTQHQARFGPDVWLKVCTMQHCYCKWSECFLGQSHFWCWKSQN